MPDGPLMDALNKPESEKEIEHLTKLLELACVDLSQYMHKENWPTELRSWWDALQEKKLTEQQRLLKKEEERWQKLAKQTRAKLTEAEFNALLADYFAQSEREGR